VETVEKQPLGVTITAVVETRSSAIHCRVVHLRPVVVYPKEKMNEIAKLVKKAEAEAENQTAFASVDDMLADMGIDIDS
jgi:ribosomal protein L22